MNFASKLGDGHWSSPRETCTCTGHLSLLPTMKVSSSVIFQLAILAGTYTSVITSNDDQFYAQYHDHPGFNLDLNKLCLVQTSTADRPVWMTELQKVHKVVSALAILTFFSATTTVGPDPDESPRNQCHGHVMHFFLTTPSATC